VVGTMPRTLLASVAVAVVLAACSGSGSGGGSGSSGSGSSGSGSSSSGGSSGSGSSGGAPIACGGTTCSQGQFCFEAGGGVALPDAGPNFTYACNDIPPQCQPTPTCACIEASDAGTNGCPCSEQNGGFLVACLYP
jgi:hypothetical protein